MPDGGVDKTFKRKRSSSSSSQYPQLLSNYPTPSPHEPPYEAVVKTEKQDQQQERGLKRKRKQKQQPLSPQESHDDSSRFLTLHHHAGPILLPESSSTSPVETSYSSKSASVTEAPGQASYNSTEQGTQTGLELPLSEIYVDWTGRGRSPFKTPAFAAIDGFKKGAKFIEWLEREAAKERKEVEKLIQWKINLLTGLKRTRLEIEQDKLDPLKNFQVLVQPVNNYDGKSKSPDKYLRKMKYSTPSVCYQRLETYEHALPEKMMKLLGLLEDNLGEGCIPSPYEVVQTMTLNQKKNR